MNKTDKIFFSFVFLLLVLPGIMLGYYLAGRENAKSCDCAKICNSEFKCGLKECPSGKSR